MSKRAGRFGLIVRIGCARGLVGLVGVSAAGAIGLISHAPPQAGQLALEAVPPPPPPELLGSGPPGTHPIWPVGPDVRAPGPGTATDVARDFAVQALGLPDPTVTEPPTTSIAGIGTVTIRLPAVDHELAVQVQRHVNGNWVITGVGESRHLEGITMLPNGNPEPVMAIHPPLIARSADLTETTPEGIHKLHLSAEDLRTGVAHLVARKDLSVLLGPPIYTVLVVYRDSANAVIDGLGGTYA